MSGMPKIAILTDFVGSGDVEQLERNPKFDVFLFAGKRRDLDGREPTQGIDHVPDHDLGCGSTGGYAHHLDVLQPFPSDLSAVRNQMCGLSRFRAELAQPVGIRTVPCADDEYHVSQLRQL